MLALHTGLRAGEMFGLQWDDVSLDTAQLTVRQSLIRVTGKGLQPVRTEDRRFIGHDPAHGGRRGCPPCAPCPSDRAAPPCGLGLAGDRLRLHHRARHAGKRVELHAAALLPHRSPRGHLHPTPAGRTQGLRLHDLRHGCGTLLISLGVKPKLVQTILRHSRLSTTMDLYVHAYDEDLRGAVASFDAALSS